MEQDDTINKNESVAWRGYEYEYREKTADWYYILAIISVAVAIAAVLFHNYLFAVLILVGAFSIAIHAAKRPDLKDFRIDNRGIKIGAKLYTYENIESFWVNEKTEPPELFMELKRLAVPLIIIPIGTLNVSIVRKILKTRLPEKEQSVPASRHIMDFFGF